jgi:hypothetical protein
VIKSQINLEPPDFLFLFRTTQTLLSHGVNYCVRYSEKWRRTQEYVVKCDVAMLHIFFSCFFLLVEQKLWTPVFSRKFPLAMFLYKKVFILNIVTR